MFEVRSISYSFIPRDIRDIAQKVFDVSENNCVLKTPNGTLREALFVLGFDKKIVDKSCDEYYAISKIGESGDALIVYNARFSSFICIPESLYSDKVRTIYMMAKIDDDYYPIVCEEKITISNKNSFSEFYDGVVDLMVRDLCTLVINKLVTEDEDIVPEKYKEEFIRYFGTKPLCDLLRFMPFIQELPEVVKYYGPGFKTFFQHASFLKSIVKEELKRKIQKYYMNKSSSEIYEFLKKARNAFKEDRDVVSLLERMLELAEVNENDDSIPFDSY